MPAVLVFPGRVRPAPIVRVHPSEDGVQVLFRYVAADLPVGEVVAAASATALRLADSEDTTADVLAGSPTAAVSGSGLEVSVDVRGAGGGDGERHKVTIESTLTSGAVVVDQFVLLVSVGPVD